MTSDHKWCCGSGCREEAVARASISLGAVASFLVPLCSDHLLDVKRDLRALNGRDLLRVSYETIP